MRPHNVFDRDQIPRYGFRMPESLRMHSAGANAVSRVAVSWQRLGQQTASYSARLATKHAHHAPESLHDMEQEDLLLRRHLRGIGCAHASAALFFDVIIVCTGAKRAVKSF